MIGAVSAGLHDPYSSRALQNMSAARAAGQGLYLHRPAQPETPVQPVDPVRPVPAPASGVATFGMYTDPESDPAEMAVRMRIQYEEPTPVNGPQAGQAASPEETEVSGAESAQKALEEGKCQTCEERKYQDGSDDPGVSFKTPTNIDPDQAASAVRGHEMEHVVRERAKAQQEDRRVVSQSVTLHTDICPECGKAYVSGGTTRTTTASVQEPEPVQQAGQEEDARRPFSAVA